MGDDDEARLSNPVPWKEMFRSVSLSDSKLPLDQQQTNQASNLASRPQQLQKGVFSDELLNSDQTCASAAEEKDNSSGSDEMDSNQLKSMNFQLALYIAIAHAGLLLLLATLYGLGLLLRDFWKPIQWAVLCSITLREIQGTLVRFWENPLQQGMLQTLLAIPFAVCEALVGTCHDAHTASAWIFGRSANRSGRSVKVGFLKLLQWLVTFALLTLGYDTLGAPSLVTAIFTGLIAYAGLSSFGYFEDDDHQDGGVAIKGKTVTGKYLAWAAWPLLRILRLVNRQSTRFIVARLQTIVAVGLIVLMILGSVAGPVIFSYKVGFEARDAVVALKDHVQQNNYTELIGLKQWLENSNVPGLIEQHASTAYETVSQQIDVFGIQYNLTEFTDAGKEYIISLARRSSGSVELGSNLTVTSSAAVSSHPVVMKLQNARDLLKEYDFKGIYSELEAASSLLLDHFQLKPEDVKEKLKQMSETGADISKRVFVGSSILLSGGTSMILTLASSIASGAAGIFNFLTQAAVFFSLLYYLVTSESGGVMEQVVSMIPLSNSTRVRCSSVLNHAVSSVLLATVKSAFYQGSFTWLLFRFFRIHFLYVSTLVAITTAVLPVLPHWLASVPAAAQLAFQGDYILALVLAVIHFLVMELGNRAIQDEIPGHNAYLAGLSIAGGMALFSPALQGAIMGPLLMTVLIALKNLYSEFVLNLVLDKIIPPQHLTEILTRKHCSDDENFKLLDLQALVRRGSFG